MQTESTECFNWGNPQTCAHSYLLPDINKLIESLELPKTAQILDAGCGGGYLLNELYKKDYKNVWGFDISESGVKVSKRNFTQLKNRFVVHDAYNEKLPDSFPQTSYDLILSIEVIEHLYKPNLYINNLSKWLKSDCYLIISTPYHGYLKNLAIALLGKHDKHFDSLSVGGHIKFFSKKNLKNLLEENSFEVLGFQGSGRFPYIWKSMLLLSRRI